MEYLLWVIVIIVSYLAGRMSAPTVKTPEEETCDYQRAQLEKDVEYYKKLTKTLVEENTEFRRKLNERN